MITRHKLQAIQTFVYLMVSWIANDQRTFAQNEEAEFRIRGYAASSQAIIFLFSFKTAQSMPLQVEATTQNETSNGQVSTSSLKTDQIQSSGKMGDYEVGLVKVTPSDIPGQLISLKATSPGKPTAVWQVVLIQQVDSLNNITAIAYHSVPPTSPAVNVQFGGVAVKPILIL